MTITVDLNHKCWSNEAIKGILGGPEGPNCASAKFMLAAEITPDYGDNELFSAFEIADIFILNDLGTPNRKEAHGRAIRRGLKIIQNKPNVKIKGNIKEFLDRIRGKRYNEKTTPTKGNQMMGSTLRNKRNELGLSLAQLSKLSGVPKSTINDAELGTHAVRFEKLVKIINTLENFFG
jgi:DNA-binding XRE family transcriptional regulator